MTYENNLVNPQGEYLVVHYCSARFADTGEVSRPLTERRKDGRRFTISLPISAPAGGQVVVPLAVFQDKAGGKCEGKNLCHGD